MGIVRESILHDNRWQEINILANSYMLDNQGFTPTEC
jgi:hypothetical protein